MRLLLASIFLLFNLFVQAQAGHDSLRAKYLRFSEKEETYDSALYYSFKVKDAAEKEFGFRSLEYIRSLNNIGYIYNQIGIKHSARHWWLLADKESRRVPESALGTIRQVIYANLKVIYHYDFKKEDSAKLYSNRFLAECLRLNGISKEYLLALSSVAYDHETVFGLKKAERYYQQNIEARRTLYGIYAADVIRTIDQLDRQGPHAKNTDRRNGLYSPFEEDYSYEYLDSASSAEVESASRWESVYYSLAFMDAAAKKFTDTSSRFILALRRVGWAYHSFLREDSIGLILIRKAEDLARSKGPDATALYLDVLYQEALLYSNISNHARAISIGEKIVDESGRIQGKNSELYSDALISLSRFYNASSFVDQKIFEKAKTIAREALNIRLQLKGDTSIAYAEALQFLGGISIRWGKLDSAEYYFLRAFKILSPRKTVRENYYLIRQIYMTYSYKEDNARQNYWLEQCIAIKAAQGDTLTEDHLYDIYNLSVGYFSLRDLKRAENELDRMQRLLRYNYDSSSYVFLMSCNLRSRIEREKGNYSAAAALLNYAIRTYSDSNFYFQDNSETLSDIATVANELSELYLEARQFDSALAANQLSIDKFNEARPDSSLAFYLQRAKIMSLMNRYDSSEYFYRLAMKMLDAGEWQSSFYYQEARISMAELYWKQGKLEIADSMMADACRNLTVIMVNNMAGFSEKEKENYNQILQKNLHKYYSLHHISQNEKTSVNAFNFLLQSKGLLLNTSGFLEDNIGKSADPKLKGLFLDLKSVRKQLAQAYSLSATNIDSLLAVANKLEKLISFHSPAFADFLKENTMLFEDVQKSLKESEAAVEFIAFPFYNRGVLTDSVLYGAFIISKNKSAPVYVRLDEHRELAPYVAKLGSSGRGASSQAIEKTESSYRILYQKIWQPLQSKLGAAGTIYLATDGVLNNVAFTALTDSANMYIGEKLRFHFVLSSKDISKTRKDDFDAKPEIALFGGARYDLKNKSTGTDTIFATRSLGYGLRGGSEWNYLPNTLTEVNAIGRKAKKHSWTVKLFTSEAASEDNFKALSDSSSPQILHIATHGFYFPPLDSSNSNRQKNIYQTRGNPLLRTGLVFSAANDAWLGKTVDPDKEDGVLTSYELSTLNLSNTKLVVLSACETGIGDVMNGEGVFGLQRALRQAGVDKMIVSLWSVPDKETAEMMEEFYNALTKGKSIGESFRSAQQSMRKKYPDDPALWAGFLLIE